MVESEVDPVGAAGDLRLVRGLDGLGLLARLELVDRLPTEITRSWLWNGLGCDEAFAYRWWELELPAAARRWQTRLGRVATSGPARLIGSGIKGVVAQRRIDRGCQVADVNRGWGDRSSNSLGVAIAVDAHWSGRPASALARSGRGDPVLDTDIPTAVGVAGHGERAASVAELERIVTTWGPGSKGIVSVRDPEALFLRVINVRNVAGQPSYADHSDPRRSAHASAAEVLASIDPRAPFASIQAWRTHDVSRAGRLPEGSHRVARDELDRRLAEALPAEVSTDVRTLVGNQIRFMADDAFTRWLCEQIWRGACTFMPGVIARLADTGAPGAANTTDQCRELPTPLTAIDEALLRLLEVSVSGQHGPDLVMWVPDRPGERRDADRFGQARRWNSPIDGLTEGTFELCVAPTDLRRLGEVAPRYEAPDGRRAGPPAPITPRRHSWIDVNSPLDRRGRRTNCWNCASSVAIWLGDGVGSTSMPITPGCHRPTIPVFLSSLGAVGRPEYVESRAQADRVARSWGRGRHGLVVASLSATSTHIFNVLVELDGSVRYLDGYVGLSGDHNFDSDWERIGMVELGALAWREPEFESVFARAAGGVRA